MIDIVQFSGQLWIPRDGLHFAPQFEVWGAELTELQAKSVHEWSDQAISRATGAQLIPGNRVRLLKDGTENYPAWLQAIQSAKKWIHFESYFMCDDEIGRQFAQALSEKAKQGVKVRLIYDWVGGFGKISTRYIRGMAEAGVDIRCFNPPRLDSPFGWLSRDHRKMMAVDGRIGYVSGLCVGDDWVGYPERGIEPWRDTGIEIEGPAMADLELSFAEVWQSAGSAFPDAELPPDGSLEPVGDVCMRLVANSPSFAGTYRLDQLFTHLARKSIWIHDSYFLGTAAYIQALRTAATSGVDVRLIVPGITDVPFMRGISRAGFRPLLEAGIRVFQWNGPMMHAKSAVVDGKWARVGSTNLNIAGWLGNWELDALVEHCGFAQAMENQYLTDLEHSTEIVLKGWQRRPRTTNLGSHKRLRLRGSATRIASGMLRFGNSVSAAISNKRELGPAEANVMLVAALCLMVIAVVAIYWPEVVIIPLVLLCIWIALSLLLRAYKLRTGKM